MVVTTNKFSINDQDNCTKNEQIHMSMYVSFCKLKTEWTAYFFGRRRTPETEWTAYFLGHRFCPKNI